MTGCPGRRGKKLTGQTRKSSANGKERVQKPVSRVKSTREREEGYSLGVKAKKENSSTRSARWRSTSTERNSLGEAGFFTSKLITRGEEGR